MTTAQEVERLRTRLRRAMRLPPVEIVVSFCAACGDVFAAVKPSLKGLIRGKHCPACDQEGLHVVRYRVATGEVGRFKVSARKAKGGKS